MNAVTGPKDDAVREPQPSQEQMLRARRRRAKDRVARERAKNLYFVIVCSGIIFVFMFIYISDNWLRASHPTLVTLPAPESWPSPHATAIMFRALPMHYLESTLTPKGTGPIKIHARGGVCCLRLTFKNESGMRRSDMVASCGGPMPDAPYAKTTIAGLGNLLGALSRGSEQTGSHDLR
jgi:uncharacterized integral membrane protein